METGEQEMVTRNLGIKYSSVALLTSKRHDFPYFCDSVNKSSLRDPYENNLIRTEYFCVALLVLVFFFFVKRCPVYYDVLKL